MIRLTDFDYRRVLDGARVPLHVPSAPAARHEWCADHYYQRNSFRTPFSVEIEAMVLGEVYIDPTDPDVARLIDRRIAEALNHALFAPSEAYAIRTGFQSDWAQTPCFFMAEIASDDGHTLQHECLNGIAIDTANLPLARAALLRALYPPEKT